MDQIRFETDHPHAHGFATPHLVGPMTRASPQTDRVIALIEALRAHPERPMTLAQVTRQLGTNKSTCHAMLTSLTGAGWLLRDPVRRTYQLGPALMAIGQVATATLPALDLAQGAMAELSEGLRLHCAALAVAADVFTVVGQVNHLMAPGPRYRVGAATPKGGRGGLATGGGDRALAGTGARGPAVTLRGGGGVHPGAALLGAARARGRHGAAPADVAGQ